MINSLRSNDYFKAKMTLLSRSSIFHLPSSFFHLPSSFFSRMNLKIDETLTSTALKYRCTGALRQGKCFLNSYLTLT